MLFRTYKESYAPQNRFDGLPTCSVLTASCSRCHLDNTDVNAGIIQLLLSVSLFVFVWCKEQVFWGNNILTKDPWLQTAGACINFASYFVNWLQT